MYETFAAERPVLGSNLGSIAELVTDGVAGLLVSPEEDPGTWAETLERVASDSFLVEKLQLGVQPPRTMKDVASDIRTCYRRVLA